MIQQEQTLDEIKQGESVTLQFTFRYESTGTVIDMSNYTMTLTVKNDPTQADADLTKADATWDKTDAASGIMAVTLSAAQTAALSAEIYHLEVKAVYGTSTIISKKDIKLPVLESIE